MTVLELERSVDAYINRLCLKSPRIRKGAAAKVFGFIREGSVFRKGQEVILPSDKEAFKNVYTKWKGYDMNSAEKSAVNHIYECFTGKTGIISRTAEPRAEARAEAKASKHVEAKATDIESALVGSPFLPVSSVSAEMVPEQPGLYCIKLRDGVSFPKDFGPVRSDRIIYIGKAESSTLRKRLWEEELNCRRPATFFRSIGAMLGYLPPKGSLAGRDTNNYKFSPTDEEKIRQWMRSNLLVNCIPVRKELIEEEEKRLIRKYTPLVNIKDNPAASDNIRAAREYCIAYAKS